MCDRIFGIIFGVAEIRNDIFNCQKLKLHNFVTSKIDFSIVQTLRIIPKFSNPQMVARLQALSR